MKVGYHLNSLLPAQHESENMTSKIENQRTELGFLETLFKCLSAGYFYFIY